jgi:Flp pilus assembly protein TadG
MQGNLIEPAHVPETPRRGRAHFWIVRAWRRAREQASHLAHDTRAIAATEFAVIVPIMLVLMLGVVEFSNGFTCYRKVSIMAHTLSDLTSQSAAVQDSDLSNFFCASGGIMTPYVTMPSPCPPAPTAVTQTIMEIWVNSSQQARVQWAKNSDGSTPVAQGTVVTIPSALAVANTYVIYSSVKYTYVPPVGNAMGLMSASGVVLSDFSYTRPRQSQCVFYNAQTSCTTY